MSYSPAKVVIIGGGFGGLKAARCLREGVSEVVIIDKTNHHLFQPLLYQVASASLSPADIATPIRQILSKQANATVLMAEVIDVDKENKQVILRNGERCSYDYLIIATGARHSYFGHNEWEHFAPGLKTLRDALFLRERLLMSFELAERCDSISQAERYLNFVCIGGGPTGVELAGAIAEIAHKTMIKNFRRIKPERARVFLIEGAPHILPMYPDSLCRKAEKMLAKMGVQVLTNTMVSGVDEHGVHVGDRCIPSTNVIWAAGNQASPLNKALGSEMDRQGRVIVGPDCSLPGHPDIFVIGDTAHFKDRDGKPLPGLAPVAAQQGRFVARIIKKRLPADKRPTFKYLDKGTMATIGRMKAVCMFKGMRLSGFMAWLAWGFIHIAYLINFRSRFAVMLQWGMEWFTGRRGARLINRPIYEEIKEMKKGD